MRWDIDQGNAPTWTNCAHTQKAWMLHELEERYPSMKQFHGQWVAIVLMGKHVFSNSRDIQKALKVRGIATGISSAMSRPTTEFSPVSCVSAYKDLEPNLWVPSLSSWPLGTMVSKKHQTTVHLGSSSNAPSKVLAIFLLNTSCTKRQQLCKACSLM